ncbi:hypothetical protein [Rhodococcus sp. 14-2483-1-1]|uniref:hypothetical protein n=1 Tax=Rhodococcus sp. 14-2483-1-1 TaxID=2023148 RepID=UPI00113FD4AC|nr:hypothetical protein [Rhodococcus sp. 14-2483-1-1]
MTSGNAPFTVRPSAQGAIPSDATWQREAERLRYVGLESIRRAASQWATVMLAVTGLLSSASAIAAPDGLASLSGTIPRIWSAGLIGAGLILAVISVGLAASAGAGKVSRVVLTGPELRTLSATEAESARTKLFISRLLALGVLPLYLAGFAVMAFTPIDDAERLMSVETLDGLTVCGLSAGPKSGLIEINSATGILAFPVERIREIELPTSCPVPQAAG